MAVLYPDAAASGCYPHCAASAADQIPAHYGADNQVDRWGSKYESLIFPLLTILFGFL